MPALESRPAAFVLLRPGLAKVHIWRSALFLIDSSDLGATAEDSAGKTTSDGSVLPELVTRGRRAQTEPVPRMWSPRGRFAGILAPGFILRSAMLPGKTHVIALAGLVEGHVYGVVVWITLVLRANKPRCYCRASFAAACTARGAGIVVPAGMVAPLRGVRTP